MSAARTETRVHATAALGLIVLGALALGGLWSMGPVPGGREWPVLYLRGYVVAWVAYVCAAIAAQRGRGRNRWLLLWIVVVAVALRVVALTRTPRPSTDIYRYLWDGGVVNAGINPYLYPPEAPQLAHLRDPNWGDISFREVRTIYPPAAQLLFAGLARIGSWTDHRRGGRWHARPTTPDLFRWAFAAFDVGSVLLLIALLRRTGRAPENVIWYAWCPLPITESTAGGHVDAAGLFFLLLAFWTAARAGRPGCASAAALAAAVMTKGFALLAVPFFVRRGGVRFAVWFALACAVMVAPFAGAGWHLFDGLTAYLSAWKVNASLFALADWLLERVAPAHFQITRIASGALILVTAAWLVWRQRPAVEGMVAGTFAALAAQLLLGAPALPWYVVWTVPLLCWWRVWGWLLFTLTVSAQYYARWRYPEQANLLLWAGYAPVYILLGWQLVVSRGRGPSPGRRGQLLGGPPPEQAEGGEQDGGAGADGGED